MTRRASRWGRLRTAAARRTAAMREAADVRRGTRRRAWVATALGFLALGGLWTGVSASVLAVNFTTANTPLDVYSNYATGIQGAGYLKDQKTANGSTVGVIDIGFKTAKLAGLCGIAKQEFGPLHLSLLIRAGAPVKGTFDNSVATTTDATGATLGVASDGTLNDSANNITAEGLFISANDLVGFGNKIAGLQLGRSSDTVTTGLTGTGYQENGFPSGANADGNAYDPASGAFGLQVDKLNLSGLTSKGAYGLHLAGNITLPKLSLKVATGDAVQTWCPTGAQP